VHGATADHSRWALVPPALEQLFTVAAIDRRGRGQGGDARSASSKMSRPSPSGPAAM
jgi:pimeloyl-ACP methyl ester carboxylesterase